MNVKKDYKQYFTPDRLAAYMVNIVPDERISSIVDLSMGECGLLEEAKKRWENAVLYGADIDEALIKKINTRSPYIHTFLGDSLSVSIENWNGYNLIANGIGFDLAIANPPFNFYDQKELWLNEERLSLPIEMRFFLKYIDIVKEEGYICIILPYGFLSSNLYDNFRMKILSKVTIIKIIKIFNKCFDKIDADTCMILMKKNKSSSIRIQEKIIIEYLSDEYQLSNKHIVLTSKDRRWDLEYQQLQSNKFSYCAEFEKAKLKKYIKLCRRGKSITKNRDMLSEKGVRYIHTTDVKKLYFSDKHKQYVNDSGKYFEKAILHKDDILVGRVGQGCIGKIGIVTKKYPRMFFSDCLFAIQSTNINPYYLTLFLASEFGQMQLKGIAKGSCSKYLTIEELFDICVLVPDRSTQDYFGDKYKMLLSKPGRVNKEVLFDDLLEELNDTIKKKG